MVERGLYPNPFGATLSIYFRLRVAAQLDLVIFDVAGEPVWRLAVEGQAGDNLVPWQGVNGQGMRCASGTYLLDVRAQGVDGTQGGFWDRLAVAR